MGWLAEVGSSILLFFLVFGMSATVELKQLWKQLRNRTALLTGLALQFVILPFCGFLVVKILHLPAAVGITLLVVTSSPGGSYSNWWCSLFNAELSLSITMTAISTLLSTIMMPANLLLYTHFTYSSDVVQSLDWYALFISLAVVIGGIACGLVSSQYTKRHDSAMTTAEFHRRANLMGNVAGIALITLSVTVSSTGGHSAALWDQPVAFYFGVAMPFLLGLSIATYMTSKFDLEKPERVAVCVEASFQNTGIATSVAITMFASNEEELAQAIGVPLYYGMVEAVGLAIFCLVCWKLGWTKAPKDENVCVVIYNSYEVEEEPVEESDVAIEVVLGEQGGGEGEGGEASGNSSSKDHSPNDLIFEQTDDGAYVVDSESLHKAKDRDERKRKARQQSPPDTPGTSEEPGGGGTLELTEPNHSNGDSPTLSSSTASEDGAEDEVSRNETPADNSDQPLEQPQQHGRITRTIATIRARATGYRQQAQGHDTGEGERHFEQDPRIVSTLDDSEEFAVPSPPSPGEEASGQGSDAAGPSRADRSYAPVSLSSSPSSGDSSNNVIGDGKQID